MRRADVYFVESRDESAFSKLLENHNFRLERGSRCGGWDIYEGGRRVGNIDYQQRVLIVSDGGLKEVVEKYIGPKASAVDSSTPGKSE